MFAEGCFDVFDGGLALVSFGEFVDDLFERGEFLVYPFDGALFYSFGLFGEVVEVFEEFRVDVLSA